MSKEKTKNKINTIVLILLVIVTAVSVFTLGYLNEGLTRKLPEVSNPREAIFRLMEGNEIFVKSKKNKANISTSRRIATSDFGQNPYATIITCSDSRLSPEHIFSEGIGDLFVIRTAGNILSDFDLGSVEYSVFHLGVKAIVVMGHSSCGAVSGAFNDHEVEGFLSNILEEIKPSLLDTESIEEAEYQNIRNSFNKLLDNYKYIELINKSELIIVQARYDINTGEVVFFI